jgi:glutaredoxin 2
LRRKSTRLEFTRTCKSKLSESQTAQKLNDVQKVKGMYALSFAHRYTLETTLDKKVADMLNEIDARVDTRQKKTCALSENAKLLPERRGGTSSAPTQKWRR